MAYYNNVIKCWVPPTTQVPIYRLKNEFPEKIYSQIEVKDAYELTV